MRMSQPRMTPLSIQRAGFTRLDLIGGLVLGLLTLGLLLPLAHAAKQKSDQLQCQDNLRKLGQAFQRFESVQGGFPPRRAGFGGDKPHGGWGTFLLPYLDQTALAKKYNFKRDSYDPENKAVVETRISTFLCPAAPTNRKVGIQAQATSKSENPNKDTVYTMMGGANDYITSNGVLLPRTGYGLNALGRSRLRSNQRQPMTDDAILPNSVITDGLEDTLLLIEQAGRPEQWRNGKKTSAGNLFGMTANARGAWAGWGSIAFGPSNRADGEGRGRGDATDCSVNCNNQHGIYGFHAKGANVLFCDGSVRFIGDKLNPLTFAYLTMRDDGHLLSSDDY